MGFSLPFLLQLPTPSPSPLSSLPCSGLWEEFLSIVVGAGGAVFGEAGRAAARVDWLKTLVYRVVVQQDTVLRVCVFPMLLPGHPYWESVRGPRWRR